MVDTATRDAATDAPPATRTRPTPGSGVRNWANMWRKAAFMALNPKVATYRAKPAEPSKKAGKRHEQASQAGSKVTEVSVQIKDVSVKDFEAGNAKE